MLGTAPLGTVPVGKPQAAPAGPSLPVLSLSTFKPTTLTSSGWTPRITAS